MTRDKAPLYAHWYAIEMYKNFQKVPTTKNYDIGHLLVLEVSGELSLRTTVEGNNHSKWMMTTALDVSKGIYTKTRVVLMPHTYNLLFLYMATWFTVAVPNKMGLNYLV